jgi:hypothetical protein
MGQTHNEITFNLPLCDALASLRESSLTLATMSHVSALAIVASKSFARRRLRFSQAMVRLTTQRRGNSSKLGGIGSFDNRDRPATDGGKCIFEFLTIAAIGEDMAQPREGTSDQLEKRGCTVAILYAGFMDDACN